MYIKILIPVILVVFSGILIAAQSNERNETRCFRFTWLGPRYDNHSIILNATCQDATRMSDGVPCELPLVASYDGSWPNIDYLWTNYMNDSTCLLADNDVCAQYTYYFNGVVENSTYMCTRAVTANDTALTSGCYLQTRGSYATRVCLCRSLPGGVPCNSAAAPHLLPIISFITFIFFILWK